MSSEQLVEQRIAAYLEREAPSRVSERVLTEAFDRTRATRQVHARRWKFLEMGLIPATFVAAAAVFSSIAVVGSALLITQPTNDAVTGATDPTSVCPTSEPAPFTSGAQRPFGMAIVCLDGSVAYELGLPRDTWTPDLSPDGSRVALRNDDLSAGVCYKCPNAPYLTVVDVGSTKGRFFIPIEAPLFQQPSQFAWAPDGKRIAFRAEHDGNVDIYLTSIDETDGYALAGVTTRLTTDPAIDESPAWSPDGSTILYTSMGAEAPDDSGYSQTQEIWSVPSTGGTPTRLTDNLEPDTAPDIAQDGRVAFWREGEIWIMNLDGSDQAPLDIDVGFTPRWSPDGTKLALLRYDPSRRTAGEPELPSPSLPLLEVVVVDLRSGDISAIGSRVVTDMNGVSWTPDGEGLLINRYDSGKPRP